MAEQYKIVYSAKAKIDLQNTLRYIRSVSSLDATIAARQRILDAIDAIARMPGRRSVYLSHDGIDIRSYEVAKQHRILYLIEEQDDEVFLVRIVHIKMNKSSILRSLEEE